jgi:hypothetical protein
VWLGRIHTVHRSGSAFCTHAPSLFSPRAKLNPTQSQDVLALSYTPLQLITLPLIFLSHFSPHFDLQFQSSSLCHSPRTDPSACYNLSSNDDSVSLVKGNNDLATLTAPLAARPALPLLLSSRRQFFVSLLLWPRSLFSLLPARFDSSSSSSFFLDCFYRPNSRFISHKDHLFPPPSFKTARLVSLIDKPSNLRAFAEHCPPPLLSGKLSDKISCADQRTTDLTYSRSHRDPRKHSFLRPDQF